MNTETRSTMVIAAISILSGIAIFFYNIPISLEWLGFMVVIGIISYILSSMKIIETEKVLAILAIVLIFSIANSFYFAPSSQISRSYGTVLTPNWWASLNWIKNNTDECATVATYWDPGHFITGIANRAVIYDGASQGILRYITTNETLGDQGLELVEYEKGITQIILKEDNQIIRARMKDVAISLFTDNESLAIQYLKDYLKPGCDEMYFIASSDLIGKSQWWTYFATWSPTKVGTCPTLENPKGNCYFYQMIGLSTANPKPNENAIVYTYPMTQTQAFQLYESEGNIRPYLQQSGLLLTVEKIFYYTNEGMGITNVYQEADVKGLLWLSPDKQVVIYIPPELENAMFTKLYFFNGKELDGQDLEHFEFINNWGGEVKLFRVKFDES